MTQIPHNPEKYWPLPLGGGLLVEVDFGKLETKVELLGGALYNLASARVRALSPHFSDKIREEFLPEGQGSLGTHVIISEPNLRYLEEAEYEACGFQTPKPEENGLGDLAFISFDKLIAKMDENYTQLPFRPLGKRVFFEYDVSDESDELVEVGSAGLVVQEKSLAIDNQLATVVGTGPDVENVKEGDRVIVRRAASSIFFEGQRYYFVSNEDEFFAVLEPVHA